MSVQTICTTGSQGWDPAVVTVTSLSQKGTPGCFKDLAWSVSVLSYPTWCLLLPVQPLEAMVSRDSPSSCESLTGQEPLTTGRLLSLLCPLHSLSLLSWMPVNSRVRTE